MNEHEHSPECDAAWEALQAAASVLEITEARITFAASKCAYCERGDI